MSYGSRFNFCCEECNFESGDGGECPRCGSWMQDVSGKEYLASQNDLDQDEFDVKDDFDLDFATDEFEEAV